MYQLAFTKQSLKDLKDLDVTIRIMVLAWIEKNLSNLENPRIIGKLLKGNHEGLWRYRVGQYRLLTQIQDQTLTILMVTITHRKDAY
jgi:mRNA interferase RelE/StbE